MKKLSQFDFQKYCQERGPFIFSFDSDDSDATDLCYVKLAATFQNIVFIYAPHQICLIDGKNQLSFNCVRHILLEEIKDFGFTFQIVCGRNPSELTAFTLFAQTR